MWFIIVHIHIVALKNSHYEFFIENSIFFKNATLTTISPTWQLTGFSLSIFALRQDHDHCSDVSANVLYPELHSMLFVIKHMWSRHLRAFILLYCLTLLFFYFSAFIHMKSLKKNEPETNHRLWKWLQVFFGRRTGYVRYIKRKA